jgi:signal transduction histidine kinase
LFATAASICFFVPPVGALGMASFGLIALLVVVLVSRDVTQRKHAEETARFLTEVSDVLASSLDYKTTLTSIARLAVPHIADWCAVHVKTEDGAIQQLALTHVDPAKVDLAQELSRYLDDPNAPYSVPNVIRTGKPELLARITDEQIDAACGADALKILADLGLRSLMVVPLIAPAETFGAITFVSAESGRRYGQSDLALAQDLAHRAALAVHNARLYHRSQSLNEELDQRVAQRTTELQNANQQLETEIAQRQRANEQLRLLAAHLQSAREEERIRIAREIHDEIGQMMTAVKIDLALFERKLDTLREEITSTTKLVDDAIATMHEVVRELRPAVLDHLGLRAAIEWQMQDFQERAKIECQFNSDLDELELDPQRSTAVFRILQEVLTNVARHAQATRVEASLRKEDNYLILEVRDNGKGIPQAPDTNGFGILGMRERAHVFGGEVIIQGSPGQGTTVTVRIPM